MHSGSAVDSRDQAQFRQMQRALQGQLVPRFVSDTATVQLSDYCVEGDATSAAFTITLPTVLDAKGMRFLLFKVDASANAITVEGAGSETINGAANVSLASQWSKAELYCDGAQWLRIT